MYEDILQQLQDPTQANEIRKNDKVYKIRRGVLMIHEDNQANDYSYWRTIVPDNEEVKIGATPRDSLRTIRRTSRLYQDVRGDQKILLLGTYDPGGETVRPGLSCLSGRKR